MSTRRTSASKLSSDSSLLLSKDIDPIIRSIIRRLGNIIGIWAHPDDEAWLSAGLMAAAVSLGSLVHCITATGGEAGSQDEKRWPSGEISNTRRLELIESLKVIGVDPEHHRFLGYQDGKCHLVDFETRVQTILDILMDVKPDTILTFGPDGFTGHPDHRAMSDAATEAFRRYQVYAPHARLLYHASTRKWQQQIRPLLVRADAMYGDEYPDVIPDANLTLNLTLTGELLRLKLAAVMAHHSQITPLMDAVGGLNQLIAWFSHEAFREVTPPPFVR